VRLNGLKNPRNITVRWLSFTNITTNCFRQRGVLAESRYTIWIRILSYHIQFFFSVVIRTVRI